ncbi:MAG: hypothetical protein JXR73_00795 [Candidatus Omnitrophica bacterium]|nr:hypothetical protein [Candidatus Omnitrophota bacterium]
MSGQAQFILKLHPKNKGLSVDSFVAIINNSLLSLKRISKELSDDKEQFGIIVQSINFNSPGDLIFTEDGSTNPDYAISVFDRMASDFAYIDDNQKFPETLTPEVSRFYREITKTLNNGVKKFNVKTPNVNEREFGSDFHKKFITAIKYEKEQSYYQWGTFDGWLLFLNLHTNPKSFRIYDVLIDRYLMCLFNEDIKEFAKKFVEMRVSVFGKATYNRFNKPVQMNVERIEKCPSGDELPRLEDLHKFGNELTDGMDTYEYVRRMRDASE